MNRRPLTAGRHNSRQRLPKPQTVSETPQNKQTPMRRDLIAAPCHPHITSTATIHLGDAPSSGSDTCRDTRIIPHRRGFSANANPLNAKTRERSGLGAFKRLAERHLKRDSAAGRRSAAARALEGIYGVDINPYAAAIARFRLLVAALRFAGIRTIAEAPAFTLNVAVGDSLLHSPPPGQLRGVRRASERQAEQTRHLYETEDAETVLKILELDYHAVVANPPYVTPKDPAANQAYRERYYTCNRQYSLAVPFMQLLFGLACLGSGHPAGFVGQITANSFMKREFGKKLVEYLSNRVDLTHVIDTSGVYVPGHGTPTLILIGRNRTPVSKHIRAVLGIRGEPSTPSNAAEGRVWLSILDVVDKPGEENDFVSASDVDRSVLSRHPWSLQGGSAADLTCQIEARSETRLAERLSGPIGYIGQTNADDIFISDAASTMRRHGIEPEGFRDIIVGDTTRDWRFDSPPFVVFPYISEALLTLESFPALHRYMWPFRTILGERRTFSKRSYFEEDRPWWEWHRVSLRRLRFPVSIAFAFVETHNHFVLDCDGKVFNRTAPAIKLPASVSRDGHLELLGSLNSSVACFWMKQVLHNKGAGGGISRAEKWLDFYEFEGTKLSQFPLAAESVLAWSRALDDTAQRLTAWLPSGIAERSVLTDLLMRESAKEVRSIRGRMVWLQEELDWRCMFLYGITEEDLSFGPCAFTWD